MKNGKGKFMVKIVLSSLLITGLVAPVHAMAATYYISYDALMKNSANYKKWGTGTQANPYQRGCSAITQCRS